MKSSNKFAQGRGGGGLPGSRTSLSQGRPGCRRAQLFWEPSQRPKKVREQLSVRRPKVAGAAQPGVPNVSLLGSVMGKDWTGSETGNDKGQSFTKLQQSLWRPWRRNGERGQRKPQRACPSQEERNGAERKDPGRGREAEAPNSKLGVISTPFSHSPPPIGSRSSARTPSRLIDCKGQIKELQNGVYTMSSLM